MNTSFMSIYQRFLNKITDFTVLDLTDEEVQSFCFRFMISAIPNIYPLKNDLNDFDEENQCFNSELVNAEIEIITWQMVVEWIAPQVNNTSLIKQFIGTKDEKFYAQSNHIEKLLDLSDRALITSKRIRRDYGYRNHEYLGG